MIGWGEALQDDEGGDDDGGCVVEGGNKGEPINASQQPALVNPLPASEARPGVKVHGMCATDGTKVGGNDAIRRPRGDQDKGAGAGKPCDDRRSGVGGRTVPFCKTRRSLRG